MNGRKVNTHTLDNFSFKNLKIKMWHILEAHSFASVQRLFILCFCHEIGYFLEK